MSPQVASFLTLVRRNLFGSICTVLIIGLAVTSWFLWQEIDALELSRQERAKEGEEMLTLLISGSTQRQELAALREATRRIEDNLVIENRLAENYQYFYRLEDQAKALLAELHPLSSSPADTSPLYRRVSFSIRATGTYQQVASFLLLVETGPHLANITSFSFSRRAAGGDFVTLDLTVDLLGKR